MVSFIFIISVMSIMSYDVKVGGDDKISRRCKGLAVFYFFGIGFG